MCSPRQRVYAALLALGAGFLLFRILALLAQGALGVMMPWVSGLLFLELILDLVTLVASIRWCVTGAEHHARFPIRTGAAAALMHAGRVLVFVLGRVGPWIDFDVRPEQRAMHAERWSWGDVYLASILSLLGVAGVLLIWHYRRRGPASVNDVTRQPSSALLLRTSYGATMVPKCLAFFPSP